MLAVVADQSIGRAMIRQTDRAVRAGRDPPAGAALDERSVATAIEQQDGLLALSKAIPDRRLELFAHHHAKGLYRLTVGFLLERRPTIHYLDLWKRGTTGALGEPDQRVPTIL